jgi:hypothetical protein
LSEADQGLLNAAQARATVLHANCSQAKEEKKSPRAVTFQGQGIMRVGFRQEALERKKFS